jgi:hypothetical protein
MATHCAIRSIRKALLAVALIGLVTTGCKKSGIGGADVDPRDQYLGTYEGGYQASTLVNNSLESSRESGTLKITITKSEAINQFYIDLLFNGVTSQKLTGELSGDTFTVIDKQSEVLLFDGKNYPGKYTATGQFVNKDIVINTVTETFQSGVTLSRRGSLTGTKK